MRGATAACGMFDAVDDAEADWRAVVDAKAGLGRWHGPAAHLLVDGHPSAAHCETMHNTPFVDREQLAVRLISRSTGEMALSGWEALTRFLPASDEAVIALAMMRVCLSDWVQDGRIQPKDGLTVGCSINSLAVSLNRSYATTHNLVTRLKKRGVVVRVDDKVALANDDTWRPLVTRFLMDGHDIMMRFTEDMHRWNQLDERKHVPHRALPLEAILTTMLDILLAPFEQFNSMFGDWTAKIVWLIITTMTVRHITSDAELSALYAVNSTPDVERRAIPAAAIAEVSCFKYMTVWRRCKGLEEGGYISRDARGWLVRLDQLKDERMEATVQAAMRYHIRRIEALMAVGLDPTRIAYMGERPPLVGAVIV